MPNPFDDDSHLGRPEPARLANSPSPRRLNQIPTSHASRQLASELPEYQTGAKFSPSVFSRRSQQNSPLPAHTAEVYHTPYGSPIKQQLTPRQQHAEMESPKRKKYSSVIIIDDEDDYHEEIETFKPNVKRSPTRASDSSSSSSRILPPPKPIFSASTFAAANNTPQSPFNDSHHNGFNLLQRAASESTTYSYEQYDETKAEFGEKLETYNSSFSGETIDSSHYNPQQYVLEANDYELDSQASHEFDDAMMHSVPTSAQPRRHRSMIRKKVQPENGNLVLENPIPTKLASFLPRRDQDEFLFMRYSACTSDPDDFESQGFTLRAAKNNREIEICVCITMYNESEEHFTRTMHAVMKNVAHLCSRNRSRIWGPDGWKKVQVVIVSDGRSKISNNVLDVLGAMGVYQEGIAKSYVNSKEVKAHLFEYTTQVSLDSNLEFKSAEKGIVPVQVLFCLKEQNQKKINSHRWLFNAFCPVLDPKVVVLLDVGTKPNVTAMYHMWKAFDRDSNVAGVAGEIKALKGKGWNKLLNPLVASQNFEYKMSNILDKPMESAFGYISVLPGALSAYRYKALRNHDDGTGPLCSYFKGEELQGSNRDVFSANMYLAEDRILCWELVAKKDDKWLLEYVKEAKGETDLPESVPEFISQRRRWLNGALFAAIYSQLHFRQVWKTNHSFGRKVALHLEFLFQFVQLLFSWFSISNFYLTFYFLVGSLSGNNMIPNNGGFWLFTILNYICIGVICSLFIVSMGNRPQGAQHLFITCMILLSICSTFAIVCGIVFVFRTLKDGGSSAQLFNIVVSLLSTYGLYFFMSFIYLDPAHMFTSSIQYFLLLPSYICTLQIFAFCNTHDVSWGTKGDNNPTKSLGNAIIKMDQSGNEIVEVDMPADQLDIDSAYKSLLNSIGIQRVKNKNPEKPPRVKIPDEDYYRDVRTRVVLSWLLSNLILILIVTSVYSVKDAHKNKYLAFILWSVAALSLFRAIGSMYYLSTKYLRTLIETKHKWDENGTSNVSSWSIKNWFGKD